MNLPNDPFHAFIDYPDVPVPHAGEGPLAGLTFAVKDIYDVAGYPTGCGNATRTEEASAATVHAACVAALLRAGARFVGKTHTVEFAYGMDGVNDQLGTPVNPAVPGRLPGGSSSGSVAAVAGGLVDIAFGSDTGGSVRVPASFCGLIGLRTTFGRIDISGAMPLSHSLDTVGWFARNGAIYERVGDVLLGEDEDETPLTRMVVATDAFAQLAGAAEIAAMTPALETAAGLFSSRQEQAIAGGELASWPDVFRTVQGHEAWGHHADWIASHPGALSPVVAARFEVARTFGLRGYEAAVEARNAIRMRIRDILGADGVIAMPTAPSPAPLIDASPEEREAFRLRALALTSVAALTGFPEISIPLATCDGAPMGLSLIGPPGRDKALIALARRALGDG